MRRILRARLVPLTIAALALAACATASRPHAVDTASRALVYGHIDAPKPVQAVQLARMLSARHPYAHVTPNGDFFFEDVAPGQYGLMRFMAGGRWYVLLNGDTVNNKRFLVKAQPGGIHYVGAWRVTGEKDNRFSPDEFSVTRVASPGERELFERLRPALAGTNWERKGGATSGGKPSEKTGAKRSR